MTLYPFQEEGAVFLAQRARAYLADDAGLGKSVQTASAAKRLKAQSPLVVAPANAIENWKREWAKWGPPEGAEVVSWASPRLARLNPGDFDLCVLDEAHYAKSSTAKRTKAALGLAQGIPNVWALSATPMPNADPREFWPVMEALWPDILAEFRIRNKYAWERRFCKLRQSPWGPRLYGLQNTDELKAILRRIMLRRRLEDAGIEMPPLRVDVSLLPRDSSFERELAAAGVDAAALIERLEALEEDDEASRARLRRYLGAYKAPKIAGILADELAEGQYEKIVVMAYHKPTIALFRRVLEPFGVVGFDGSATPAQRQREADKFCQGPARVFVGQQVAAGIAINLQVAHEIVLAEPSDVPDENWQAIKRVHRIGSTRSVRARMFAVAGSLDERIINNAAAKTRRAVEIGL